MRIFFWLTAVLAGLAAAPAMAQQGTAEQRAACEGDAYRLCDAYVPDAILIERCLRAKASSLSPGCRAEFGFPTAAAESGGKRHKR